MKFRDMFAEVDIDKIIEKRGRKTSIALDINGLLYIEDFMKRHDIKEHKGDFIVKAVYLLEQSKEDAVNGVLKHLSERIDKINKLLLMLDQHNELRKKIAELKEENEKLRRDAKNIEEMPLSEVLRIAARKAVNSELKRRLSLLAIEKSEDEMLKHFKEVW